MFAADILRKEKECFEQNKAYFCKNSAKIGVLMSYKEIISAYDVAIALLEARYGVLETDKNEQHG